MSHKKNLSLGVLLSLISFFCLATTNALVKILNGRIDLAQILFLQSLFGLVVMCGVNFFSGKKLSFYKSKHYRWLFFRSIAGLIIFFLIYISLRYLSIATTTLLFNTAPFFIPFLSLLYFQEKINPRLWAGIIPGFIGIACILDPTGSDILRWHVFLPLMAGLCVAMNYITLRQLHFYKEPMNRILWYLFFFATLITLPFGIYYWENPTPEDWIWILLICINSAVAQTLITLSLRYGSPKALAPLCYSSVLFALLFDWLIWNTIPSWISMVGMGLVIMGGIIALVIEVKLKEVTAESTV